MFEFIVKLYKYIQQNPAGVSSVQISEPSAQYLVSPPSAAVTRVCVVAAHWWNIWTLCQGARGSGLNRHKFWIGSISELRLGRCRTSNLLSLTVFFAPLAVSLGSSFVVSCSILFFLLCCNCILYWQYWWTKMDLPETSSFILHWTALRWSLFYWYWDGPLLN